MSSKPLGIWILRSSGCLKHSVIKGANSNVVVRHWLHLKPGAVIVRWWSSFIRMETGQLAFGHFLLTLAVFPPVSDIDNMGNFGLLHPVNLLCLVLPRRCSAADKLSKHCTQLPHYFRMSVSVYMKSYPLSLVVCRRRFCRHLGCTSLRHYTSGCCLLSFSYHPRAVTGSSCCYHCNFQSLLKP